MSPTICVNIEDCNSSNEEHGVYLSIVITEGSIKVSLSGDGIDDIEMIDKMIDAIENGTVATLHKI